jgi:F-type H+-transporting ATPase subunit epsilon
MMAEAFHFELVSPEKHILSGMVEQVIVPGREGELTILAQHAPFLASLRPGFLTVTNKDGSEQRFFVRGGFADTNPEGLTILAEEALSADKLDETYWNAAEADLQARLDQSPDEETRQLLAEQLRDVQTARAIH